MNESEKKLREWAIIFAQAQFEISQTIYNEDQDEAEFDLNDVSEAEYVIGSEEHNAGMINDLRLDMEEYVYQEYKRLCVEKYGIAAWEKFEV